MANGTAATTAVFLNLCQDKTFLFSYLCSEIKTKNHRLHESCKTPPPPLSYSNHNNKVISEFKSVLEF